MHSTKYQKSLRKCIVTLSMDEPALLEAEVDAGGDALDDLLGDDVMDDNPVTRMAVVEVSFVPKVTTLVE